ncbi:hypothetical protein V497_05783 [Pseudogymnoascus sp. VKM F-4516 (FW-969)]|nr:hypothetical protein V497_05783 [Pseudogymnoascus sp. VKM F-4516 (FW-969)]
MAYQNNPLFDLLRALDPQQANQEQASNTQPQTPGATGAQEQPAQPQHPFAAFHPFFAGPQYPHHGAGRRGGGRRCPRGECPAMNPEAAQSRGGPLDGEAESQGPHGGRHHGHGRHGGRGGWGREPPAYAAFGGQGVPFDISAFVNSLASHPIAEALRNAARGADAPSDPNTAPAEGEARNADESDSFSPAIDTFSTPTEYVLHIALPGARKEDVGVNWDAEKGELNIAGVVYRAGDEEFIASLKTGERRVGVFERSVKLPLESDEKVEVDGEEISAKLEDGVLVVRVGKVVKEEAWTDLKRVEVL